jgi:two-component system response regulator YesN
MNTEDLEQLRKLTDSMDHGPSGFFDAKHPATKVLFVDDESMTCQVFKRLISKRLDVEVFCAPNAMIALEVLRLHHHEIAVMLTDIRMPGMNGVQLVRQVRRLYPEIVCLLTTAYADEAYDDCGADGLIWKPWNTSDVVQKINLSILKAAA